MQQKPDLGSIFAFHHALFDKIHAKNIPSVALCVGV